MSTKKYSVRNLITESNLELVAGIIVCLMAAQPLFGLFETVSQQSDLIALFYGKATVIRFIGICGLFVGFLSTCLGVKHHGSAYLKKKFIRNPWNLMFLVMLVWTVITSATAVNPTLSLFSYAYRYEGLLSYFAYAGIFMCGSMIKSDRTRNSILDFTITIATVVAIATLLRENFGFDALMERNGWVGEYSGTFINTNHYGYYLSIVLMLCAGRFYHGEKIKTKVLCILSFLVNLYVLLQNDSFGPYLAVSVALVVYFIILTVRDSIKKSVLYLAPIVIFFVMGYFCNNHSMFSAYATLVTEAKKVIDGILGIASADTDSAVTEIESDIKAAGSGRMAIWIAAFNVWKEHIVMGCGPENVPMEMYEALGSYEATHNTYLQVLAEMGVIGLVIYLASHITFFVRNIRRSKTMTPSTLIFYGAAAAYLVSALFGITITVCEVFLYFALGLANAEHTKEAVDELLPPEDAFMPKTGSSGQKKLKG